MSKYDLAFTRPLMNASGSLGFAPDLHGPVDLTAFGAFVTNPISLEARTPARGDRVVSFPGCFLLHTGYPNPGLKAVLRHYTAQWAGSRLPVIVHLLPGKVNETQEMVHALERALERSAGLSASLLAVEIGLHPEVDEAAAADFARAAGGEIPVIVRLPFEGALRLAQAVAQTGIAAVSVAPARGAARDLAGNLMHGRLYGPALFSQALATVAEIARAGIPVIGAGGVYQQAQVAAMLSAGAIAVQVDAALWCGGLAEG